MKWIPVRLASKRYRDLRSRVLHRDGWHCQACGSTTNLTVHHQQQFSCDALRTSYADRALTHADFGLLSRSSSRPRYSCSRSSSTQNIEGSPESNWFSMNALDGRLSGMPVLNFCLLTTSTFSTIAIVGCGNRFEPNLFF
jgi:hypothetical protein